MKKEDKKLLNDLVMAVKEEKQLTIKVLELLQEVENKKLYADLGHRSLFAYCTDHLKYSEAEACVRVNATRLVKAIPEIKKNIQDGTIGITQASRTQSLFSEGNISTQKKMVIIENIKGKSTRETEKILNEHKTNKTRSKKVILKDALLKKIQDEFEGLTELEVIEALIDKHIEDKKKQRPSRKSTKKSKNVRYISRTIKEEIDTRAKGRCEYVSSEGVHCSCRTHLEYDHIRAISIGGRSTQSNIRKLCRVHNSRAAIRKFGAVFMQDKILRGYESGTKINHLRT